MKDLALPGGEQFSHSCIDLGWLRIKLETLYKAGMIKAVDDVYDFLIHCVKGVKMMSAYLHSSSPNHLTVYFKTKGDGGWFCYEFGIYDPKGIDIREVPVKGANGEWI